MVTLKKIAEELGVSIATVSYIFNNKWRKNGISKELAARVRKRLAEKNYQPNSLGLQLKTKKTQTIGVVLGDLTRNHNLNILAGIEKVLAKSGYLTLICNSNLGILEKEHLETLHSRNVEGIIFSPHNSGKSNELVGELIKEGVPIIMVDDYLPQIKTDFVVSDNFWGSYQATRFLIDKGCKKVGYLGSKKNLIALKERFRGYASALQEKGISLSRNLICREATDLKEVYSGMEKIFSREKPDAIFIESLLYFREGFKFLLERGLKVPDDIVLTGFDPIDLTLNEIRERRLHSLIKKPIPFAEQKGMEMGELAARILLDKIKSKKKKKVSQIFLKPNLKFFDPEESYGK